MGEGKRGNGFGQCVGRSIARGPTLRALHVCLSRRRADPANGPGGHTVHNQGQWKNGRSYDGNPGAAQRVAPAGRLARQTATRVASAGGGSRLQHRVPVRSRLRDADVERRVEFALEGARDGRDGSNAPG